MASMLWLACLPATLAANHGSDSSRSRRHNHLKLTSEQKTKMEALRLQLKKDLLPIQNQMAEKEARLRTLETAEKPDLQLINSTIEEIQALKTRVMKLRAANKQEVRKILTPDQRVEFDLGKDNRHRGDRRHKPHHHHREE